MHNAFGIEQGDTNIGPWHWPPSDGLGEALTITLERRDLVAWLFFSRPDALNAIAPGDLPRLAAALEVASSLPDIRSIVIAGADGAFSSGDDLGLTALLDRDAWHAVVEGFHELTRVARRVPVPIVCAIDGVCVGGAFEFVCSCDLRIATNRAQFGCPEVNIGIAPSNGATLLLARLCGVGIARDLILTGRLIDAAEAHRVGIVTQVVEPAALHAVATTLATRLATRAPLAMVECKRLLNEAESFELAAAMTRESDACVRLFDTADFREALAAFESKRDAIFNGA